MKRFFIPSLFIIAIFCSCSYFGGKRVRGNGQIKTESRTVGAFTNIDVSDAFEIYLTQDSVSSVKVETDENLQEYVMISNDDNTLTIRTRQNTRLRPTGKMKIYISNAKFGHLEATGASNIYSQNKLSNLEAISISAAGACSIKLELSAPKIDVDLTGAGSVSLKGETKDLKLEGSGSTDIHCFEMLAENTTVDMTGAGHAEVFASVTLRVEVSGAADVRYKGNGAVTQSITGAGSVKKVD